MAKSELYPRLKLGWLAIGLLLLASLYPLWRRHAAESRNLAVSIAAEYEVIEGLAAGQGISMEDAAQKLKASGFDTLVLNEESVGDLIARGDIELVSTSVNDPIRKVPIRITSVKVNDPSVKSRIERGLANRFGTLVGTTETRDGMFSVGTIPQSLIRATAIGLNPDQTRYAEQNRFSLVVRAGNAPAATEGYIRKTIEWLAESKPIAFLPQGDQVLGRKPLLKITVEELKTRGIAYATPEFTKIAGDAPIVAMAPDNVMRLHTAQLAELDKLTTEGVVDRYVKAARERTHRILLVRPATNAANAPLDDFAKIGQDITTQLRKEGLVVARPHVAYDPDVSALYAKTLGPIGVFGLWFALLSFVPVRWHRGLTIACLALLPVSLLGIGKDVVVLAIAVILPVLGFVLATGTPLPKHGAVFTAASIGIASFASLVGGLFVAASMTGLPYMVRAEEFTGVKVAVFLPVVWVGLLLLFRGRTPESLLKQPITYGALATTIVLAGILAVLLARTGNDGLGASGLELLFRDSLEQLLFVRPRTKEFLFGHPFAVIAFAWFASRPRDEQQVPLGLALASAMAAIGQTGIVNTLCHGHIPLQLSLVRIFLGLALGCIIGAVIWGFGNWLRVVLKLKMGDFSDATSTGQPTKGV